jgi:hypothetical protein
MDVETFVGEFAIDFGDERSRSAKVRRDERGISIDASARIRKSRGFVYEVSFVNPFDEAVSFSDATMRTDHDPIVGKERRERIGVVGQQGLIDRLVGL